MVQVDKKRYFKPVLRHLILFSLLMMYSHAKASDQSLKVVRYYTEQKGSEKYNIVISILNDNGYQTTYKKASEIHITRTNENMNTTSWMMEDPKLVTSIEAVRKGTTISIKGRFKDQSVNKTIEIDSSPWFQATSLSLKKLALSEQKEIQFWMLRPGTLNAYKLKAVKLGKEMVAMENESVESIKIQLRLTGLLAPFWKSYYWFRIEDGLFVRFESMQDLIGTDPAIITYIRSDVTASMESPIHKSTRDPSLKSTAQTGKY